MSPEEPVPAGWTDDMNIQIEPRRTLDWRHRMSRTASMRPSSVATRTKLPFPSEHPASQYQAQHDHHATRSNVLLCELDGSDMRLKYAPVWSAEFNLALRSYPKVQTFRDDLDDHATSSRYLELVLDFKEKPHCM